MKSLLLVVGITPIYMGSTSFAFPLLEFPGDHPHIHGEHFLGNNFDKLK